MAGKESEKKPLTRVLFRVDRRGEFKGHLTAVFPDQPEDWPRWIDVMACYAHVGQHGSCDRGWYNTTRPADPREYKKLRAELEGIGYRLQILQRFPRRLRLGGPQR